MDASETAMIASLVALVALAASLALVPLVRRSAIRLGVVDAPDLTRKLHAAPIALGGGLAVLLATLAGAGAAYILTGFDEPPGGERRWAVLLGGAVAICILGVLDDWVTLRGRQKLFGQMLVVTLVVGSGTVVRSVDLFGYTLPLGIFALPVTILWLLGAINALNLLDGADGVAATIGAILAAGLAAMAFIGGKPFEGCIALSLALALLGFLAYNRPPASIFLGDGGSMMIGLVLGVLAVWCSLKSTATVAAIVPVALMAIPLFDSGIAIMRRILTGRSIYACDRAHLHHVLADRGLQGNKMLVTLALLCGTTTAAAVASLYWNQQAIAVAGTLLVLGAMVATGLFGRAELHLLARRTFDFGGSLMTRAGNCDNVIRHHQVRLQGSRHWDTLWTQLAEFAEIRGLARVKLDLNLAWMHEGYHGLWQRARQPDRADQWMFRTPIAAGDRIVGNLEVVGRTGNHHSYQTVELLMAMLADLQPSIDHLAGDLDPTVARIDAPGETTVKPAKTIEDRAAEPVAY